MLDQRTKRAAPMVKAGTKSLALLGMVAIYGSAAIVRDFLSKAESGSPTAGGSSRRLEDIDSCGESESAGGFVVFYIMVSRLFIFVGD